MTTWFKSTFSGSDKTCVEIAHRPDSVLIRDSKYVGPEQNQPIITVPATHWQHVLDQVLSATPGTIADALTLTLHPDGSAALDDATGTTLSYNAAEWDAFTKGIADGQFSRP
ncbi:DUF397 domain-containing protein [Nocardia vaccinii]|uniref:DUF397 domain-containing protein n=1 Tax=Nocardia vaccinii TaxID=1822 RepID=UPI00082A8804|nr:DUF397 domain-containing protein [Nocardia vaccinii]